MLFAHALSALCNKDQFTCKSGQCIDERYRCNKKADCWDHSDEEDCDGKIRRIICCHLMLSFLDVDLFLIALSCFRKNIMFLLTNKDEYLNFFQYLFSMYNSYSLYLSWEASVKFFFFFQTRICRNIHAYWAISSTY